MVEVTAINALNFIVDEAFNALSDVDVTKTKVVWFGYTVYIDIIQKALISRGKRIHYIIDNDPEKWGMILEDDLIVFPVEQIVNSYKENAIFLVSSRFEPQMREQLLALGVNVAGIVTLPSQEQSGKMALDLLLSKTAGLKKMEPREMQIVILKILKTFRDFCEEKGLRYFLAGGTLLGAVRHKGFIPWDDDADVYLPYEDYMRFINEFKEKDGYEVLSWQNNPDYVLDFSKLVYTGTVMIHGGYPITWLQCVSICVIPLSGYPDEKEALSQKWQRNKMLDLKWYWYQNAKDVIKSEPQDLRQDIFSLKNNMPFDDSPLTAKTHLQFKNMWHVPHWVFASSVPLEFEGERFSAPVGYDYYLTRRFGDYMKLLPEDERVKHPSIPFWNHR